MVIFGILLINSCSNSYEDIFTELNEKCSISEDKTKVKSVTDEGYSETEMLNQDVYTIMKDSFLILNGPKDGVTYTWTAIIPKKAKRKEKTEDIGMEAVLEYEMPGVFLEGEENILQLVVTTSDGRKFVDKAKILLISRDNPAGEEND